VANADNREVPFSFQVNEPNIYHVKIIMENRLEEMVGGHGTRRGLVINGLAFRRGRE
jgi:hypothetical protein